MSKKRIGPKHFFVIIPIIGFIFGALYCSLGGDSQSDSSLLNLERIFSSREFATQRFGPARWLKDGSGYTTLEPSQFKSGGRDIIRYNPENGQKEILVAADRLIPSGKSEPLEISNYTWSQDGKKLLIFTNTQRVWRQNTRGDYWVLDLQTWRLQQMGGFADPSTLMFAKFSDDGGRVAYVCLNNIYVEDLNSGKVVPLTQDGSETIINGTFDWVYEEEFGLRDGFRWSPNGKYIAYWQLDSEGIKNFNMINTTDYLYPKTIPIKYPKVGTINSASRIGIVSAAGGETRWLELDGNSRDYYLARMDWAANSEEVILQRLNRLQNTNWVILGNIHTGKTQTIFTDQDETWVEVVNDLRWMDEGKRFTWVSERDGWKHVYLISRDGQKIECITKGDYDVESIRCIDSLGGWLYFIASPENPTQRYLYRVPLSRAEQPERLTPLDQAGNHSYQISDDGKWAFHTYSAFAEPPEIELVHLPEHKSVRTFVDNAELRKKVAALKKQPVEFFRVDIGKGVELDAWCMKPPDFDPQKKYPLFFFVYGEPAGTTVSDRWGGSRYLWHLMLTQKGYIVMSVDNRGTRVPRGREWRKCIYRQIGILASADQAAAAKAIIKSRPYIDPNRIGIWGWSGGGSMSLNAIFRYPDLYHTAMAIAFVADQRLYDTIYQERYMGLPDDNEEGYRNGSPITFAHQLKGNLLLVHGTGDDNVHYQNFERLVNELIKHNKYFSMMSYPNRSHGIYEGENTTRHLYELLTHYLQENLPPGPAK